jgi:hypothetical protein
MKHGAQRPPFRHGDLDRFALLGVRRGAERDG